MKTPSTFGSRGSQKKQPTCNASSRRQPIVAQSLEKDEPSPYDFPDTEGSETASPPSKRQSPKNKRAPKAQSYSVKHSATNARRHLCIPTRAGCEEGRKRKHGTAFVSSKESTSHQSEFDMSPSKETRRSLNTGSHSEITSLTRGPTTEMPDLGTSPIRHITDKPPPKYTLASPHAIASRQCMRPAPPYTHLNRTIERDEEPQNHHRRPRLIDLLANQTVTSPDANSEVDDYQGNHTFHDESPINGVTNFKSLHNSTLSDREPRSKLNRTPIGKKIRHTYGQNRSIRTNLPNVEGTYGLCEGSIHDSLIPSPPSMSGLGEFDIPADCFDMDEDEFKIGIKSVHELRRAGANSRFGDEMEDLLLRIGTPSYPASSMRRNALLELAQKLHHETFAVQFRDHSARDNVVKDIGKEKDLVCGFALASGIAMFLSFNNAPNLLCHMVDQGIGQMLGRLICVWEDVDSFSHQRKLNLSKASQRTLSKVKQNLLQTPIWQDYNSSTLSPQTISLQLLDILHRDLGVQHQEVLLKQLGKDLEMVIERYAQSEHEQGVGMSLILSILESQSGISGTPGLVAHSARFLEKTLKRWPKFRLPVDSLTLRLAINATNSSAGAEAFGQRNLIPKLAQCICDGLRQIQISVDRQKLQVDFYNELLLVLGVTINILEHHPPARVCEDNEALDKLAALHMKNRNSVSEADSEDKSKVNVALGYLAIVVGYLSLDADARTMINKQTGGLGLAYLIGSIKEFMQLYKSVENKTHGLESLVNELQAHALS